MVRIWAAHYKKNSILGSATLKPSLITLLYSEESEFNKELENIFITYENKPKDKYLNGYTIQIFSGFRLKKENPITKPNKMTPYCLSKIFVSNKNIKVSANIIVNVEIFKSNPS